jgi:hypothetical protein
VEKEGLRIEILSEGRAVGKDSEVPSYGKARGGGRGRETQRLKERENQWDAKRKRTDTSQRLQRA